MEGTGPGRGWVLLGDLVVGIGDMALCRGVGKGWSRGSDDHPFLGANFIHFLYKVLGLRSVLKKTFKN